MFRDWLQAIRIFSTRFKIERSFFPTFPRFRTTQLILLIVAFFGLGYGHLYAKNSDSQSLSLLLSFVGWFGSVFILLLVNPFPRLKRLVFQIISILLLMAFIVASTITYSFIFLTTAAVGTIKVAWIGGSILLGALALYSLFTSFIAIHPPEGKSYPGMRTAPLLFLLLAINYLLWSWDTIVAFLL